MKTKRKRGRKVKVNNNRKEVGTLKRHSSPIKDLIPVKHLNKLNKY